MHEIICPHCSKAFKIDEAGYANILKQVRDGDFDKQLHERLELAEREKRDAIALAEAKVTNALQSAAARKDVEIQALQAQLAAADVARKLAVPVYPELAIRELVANALIHQDLSITGSGPMVEIFDDRIEITNPGVPLVETSRMLDSPPRSRNEGLASLMRRMGSCEERGSGVDKVV